MTGTVTFRTAARAATVARAGRTVARGTAVRGRGGVRLLLDGRRALPRGRYTLKVTEQRQGRRTVARTTVTVR